MNEPTIVAILIGLAAIGYFRFRTRLRRWRRNHPGPVVSPKRRLETL